MSEMSSWKTHLFFLFDAQIKCSVECYCKTNETLVVHGYTFDLKIKKTVVLHAYLFFTLISTSIVSNILFKLYKAYRSKHTKWIYYVNSMINFIRWKLLKSCLKCCCMFDVEILSKNCRWASFRLDRSLVLLMFMVKIIVYQQNINLGNKFM